MEPKQLLKADYLDIIFDNRNKEYGGYELRKHYNRRLGKAAAILFLASGVLISFSFITTHPADKITTSRTPVIITEVVIPEKPKIFQKILPPPPSPPSARLAPTKALTIPKIAPDKDVPPDKQLTENKNMTNAQPGFINTTGDSSGTGIENTGVAGNGTLPEIAPPSPPLKWVTQMPVFNGDINAYINRHLQYPEAARAGNIEGLVLIQFVVNEDGSVSDAKIVRGIGGGCDGEALRMVSGMPGWKPGKQNGIAVKVFFTLPVRFVLN